MISLKNTHGDSSQIPKELFIVKMLEYGGTSLDIYNDLTREPLLELQDELILRCFRVTPSKYAI
jgi:hypothetical protein